MNTEANAVIKEYKKEMAEYPAKMKKYEEDMKLFMRKKKSYNGENYGLIWVALRFENEDPDDPNGDHIFDAMVTEKGCKELVASIEKHHVGVRMPYEPLKPNKPRLCVQFDNPCFPF